MTIDTRTPEDRQREIRNIGLLVTKKHVDQALENMEYLISDTPTGDRRNKLTEVNIYLMNVQSILNTLNSEEKS